MNPLVTPSMMKTVRDIGNTGLVTEMSILVRSIVEGTDGNEDYEVWATTDVVLGWVYQNDRGPILHLGDHDGGIVSIGRYRINLPYDVVIQEGDMLGLNGKVFMVNAVNDEDTYRVFTTVTGRMRD